MEKHLPLRVRLFRLGDTWYSQIIEQWFIGDEFNCPNGFLLSNSDSKNKFVIPISSLNTSNISNIGIANVVEPDEIRIGNIVIRQIRLISCNKDYKSCLIAEDHTCLHFSENCCLEFCARSFCSLNKDFIIRQTFSYKPLRSLLRFAITHYNKTVIQALNLNIDWTQDIEGNYPDTYSKFMKV